MRTCISCNTEIDGRIDKVLCSSTCTVRRFRKREKALAEIKELLLSAKNKEIFEALIADLQAITQETSPQ